MHQREPFLAPVSLIARGAAKLLLTPENSLITLTLTYEPCFVFHPRCQRPGARS
jgi:hypothetical protein